MVAYEIQTFADGKWTNSAELLGQGCTQQDNLWPSEAAAFAAIEELVAAGFDSERLRVALA